MPAIKDNVKEYIVTELARYNSLADVIKSVKEQFGISVDQFQVMSYNPTLARGKGLAKKWQDHFWRVRDEYRTNIAKHHGFDDAWRMGELERMYRKASESGNMAMAADLLKQMAQERLLLWKVQGGEQDNNPFRDFLNRVSGTALPVVHGSGNVMEADFELIEDEPAREPVKTEVEQVEINPKKENKSWL